MPPPGRTYNFIFKCTECESEFKYYCGLTTHVNSVHKKIHHKCTFCGKVFNRKDDLRKHQKRKHPDLFQENHYQCNYCNGKFRSKHKLREHPCFRNKIVYNCNECDAKYTTQHAVSRHFKITHKNIVQSCPFCQKQFTTKYKMKLHVKEKHSKQFKKFEKFQQEMRDRKKEPIQFPKCHYCDGKFDNKDHLLDHPCFRNRIEGLPENNIGSPKVVDKTSQHHQWFGNDQRKYKCNVCEAKFTCQSSLRRHKYCFRL